MPLRVRKRSRRTLDQRFALRFPRLARAYFRLFLRLPPSSRVRQAAVSRFARLGAEAYNRRDLDAMGIGYHPEFEYHIALEWGESGLLEPVYHGLEGHRRYVASTAEVFGAEVYLSPTELLDLGDRLVMLGSVPMRAQASGIELTEEFALVTTLKDGMIFRIHEYYDHDEALREAFDAAGIEQPQSSRS